MGPEDPTTLSISLVANGEPDVDELDVSVGDTVSMTVTVYAKSGVETYEVSYEADGTTYVLDSISPDSSVIEYSLTYEFIIDYTLSAEEAAFTFRVTDKKDNSQSAYLTLNVAESAIRTSTNVTVSPFNYLDYGNIYNVEDDTVYFPANVKTYAANQTGSDMLFAFDTDLKWMMLSIDSEEAQTIWGEEASYDWPFTSENATRFVLVDLSEEEFDDIYTAAQIKALYTSGTDELTGLAVGDVIAFQLDESKGSLTGVMHITSIVGNTSSERQLTFDLKLQAAE